MNPGVALLAAQPESNNKEDLGEEKGRCIPPFALNAAKRLKFLLNRPERNLFTAVNAIKLEGNRATLFIY
jgi:hypothetical protein